MLSERVFDFVQQTLGSVSETTYTHDISIDPDTGVYDTDCSGFVSFVLEQVAPIHGDQVPDDNHAGRPLARDFETFIDAQSTEPGGRWQSVPAFLDARAGDIVAWRREDQAKDTGHVFFVAETPVVDAQGVVSVLAYDSSDVPHFDDSRRRPDGTYSAGLGSGRIRFELDAAGRATTFRFDQREPRPAPIVVGRLL